MCTKKQACFSRDRHLCLCPVLKKRSQTVIGSEARILKVVFFEAL